ncbi:nuclear transport factor 2 family protein, partial [Rhizobium ruizarguesonis]
VEWLTRDEFIAAILQEEPAPPGTHPYMDIQSVDVEGDAASVKVTDDFSGMRFTDYLSLLKIDGIFVMADDRAFRMKGLFQ